MGAIRKTTGRKKSAQCYRFAKQTMLARNEMRINFLQSDRDALELITSTEALGETKLLAHVYLRLLLAQRAYSEREGVLRFTGSEQMTAWQQLVEYLRVADATARKSLVWLEEQGAIGYWAGKNGAGIRIFINRAVNSIKKRPEHLMAVASEQKILPEFPASIEAPIGSQNEAAFKTEETGRDLKTKIKTHAPINGAKAMTGIEVAVVSPPGQRATDLHQLDPASNFATNLSKTGAQPLLLDEESIVKRIERRLEPALLRLTAAAAAREHYQTRRWLDDYGIPKAVRVAHRESHVALKRQGITDLAAARAHKELTLGAEVLTSPGNDKTAQRMSITEAAEVCAMMFEVHGRTVDDMLRELTSAGCLQGSDDAAKVHSATLNLLAVKGPRCSELRR